MAPPRFGASLVALMLTLPALVHAQPINGTWTSATSGGFWHDTTKWAGGTVAGGAGAIADFSTINPSGVTIGITANANVTVGTLLIGDTDNTNAVQITIAQGSGLTFDNNGAGALLHNVPSASNTAITGSVKLADNVTVQNDKIATNRFLDLRGEWSAATTGLKTITFSGNSLGNTTVNATTGSISDGEGQVRVVQASSGSLILSGANTYSGGTYVNAGTLSVSSDASLGAAGTSLTLAQDASFVVTSAFNTASSKRALILNGDATVQTTGFVNWYGEVSGTGKLIKTGTSTLSLNNGDSTHTGGIQVDQGVLRIRGGDGSLGALSNAVTLANETTFRVQHTSSATETAINAARTATLTSGTVTFDTLTATSWAGTITGAGGLTKTGASSFTLTGTADYAGNTTISAGTFALADNATLSSPVISVADGATFDVSERIGGFRLAAGQNIDIAGTGVFAGTLGLGSNAAIDTITLSNHLNLAATSGLLFDIGATSDLLNITGNFTAAGPVSVQLNFLEGFAAGTYTLLNAALISDPSLFVLDSSNLLSGYNYSLLGSGSSLQLAVSAIPEPSTYALIGGVLALGFVAWRRRRATAART